MDTDAMAELKAVSEAGNIDALYSLLGKCGHVFEQFDGKSLVENPIHIAARNGHTHFALEVMRLKPSLALILNAQGLSPLHLAVQKGRNTTVLRLVEMNKDLVRVQGREGMTPLHCAAEKGNHQLLVAFLSANLESLTDVTIRKQTALHVALENNMVDCVDVLLSVSWKKLLNWQDEDGNTPLHIATKYNQFQVVKKLIDRQVDISATNRENSTALDVSQQLGNQEIKNLLLTFCAPSIPRVYSSVNNCMRISLNERLMDAAEAGNISMLYSLLEEEPYLLQYVDDIPFAETPLHVAIRFGHFHFAVEILKLKPSFCRRPNQEGLYPIHLATKNGHNCKILQRLLAVDGGDLVRLPWREDKTPLHLAAEQGDVHLLRMLLSACPLSILDVTIRNETALHITLKENKLDAFHCLLRQLRTALHEGSKEEEKKILNSKDEEGNTLLHIATRNNYPQVVRVLLSCGVKVNAKNSVGSAALDVAQGDSHKAIRQMLMKAKPSRTISSSDHHQDNNIQRSELSFVDSTVLSLMRYKRGMSMEVRSLLLVVSVLIATVVYEAALDPPTIKDDRAKNNNVSLLLNIMAMTNSSSNTHNYTVSFSNINGSRNSTTSSRIHALLGDTSYTTILFWTSNILALSSSVLTVFAILPSEYIHSVLFVPLYGFSLCYVVSTAFTGSLLWFVITLVLLKVLPGGLLYVYRVSFRFKPRTY